MPYYILYLVKLSISLTIVWLFYRLFLQRLTFYVWNRWYLLVYSLLSFVMPLVNITPWVEKQSFDEGSLINYIPVLATGQKPIAATQLVKEQGRYLMDLGWNMLLAVLMAGAAVLLIRLFFRILSFRKIRRSARLMDNGEGATVRLYHVDGDIIPFSFGNAIYINQHLHTEKEWEEIILHEYVHVRQRHTIDILVAEWLCILNWYNPFAWLIRFSIRQNLEFIADNKVLENGSDRKAYQYHLLKVVGSQPYRIANSFNFSSLKKRIVMMNRIRSARIQLVKFLFLLPLMAVLLLAFRDQYKGIFNSRKTTLQANFAGLVIDISTHQPLAGVEVSDSISGATTITDENGYFKIREPLVKDSAGHIHFKGGYIDVVFGKSGYENHNWAIASGMPLESSFGLIRIIPLIPKSGSTASYFQPPLSYHLPEDPSYDDVLQAFRAIEGENADAQLFMKMRSGHPEVSMFYTGENKSRQVVILRDGRVEKYGYPDGPGIDEMARRYGPLPERIIHAPQQQVSSNYLTGWRGIAARLEKTYHTANPEARRIIFPGDSRIIVLDQSGSSRLFDMESMAPEERPAFEKLYGRLPDFVPGATLPAGHQPLNGIVSEKNEAVSEKDMAVSEKNRPSGISARDLPGNIALKSGGMLGRDTLKPEDSIRKAPGDSLAHSFSPDKFYVVDGMQMPPGWSPRYLDQSSIQSISVLKGANGVSAYGARAYNGVLVITTNLSKPTGSTIIHLHSYPPGPAPLYMVDGIEEDSAQFLKIVPADIQSIMVLKGEAAEKKYGKVKAKNGVIEVTLKPAASAMSGKASAFVIRFGFDGQHKGPLPIFIVNGQQMDSAQVMKIPPNAIDSLSVLTDGDAVKRYGEKGRNGVFQIHLKTPAPGILSDDRRGDLLEDVR